MLRRFFFLISLALLVACNDGNILTVELEFEGDLGRCDNDINSYLLFDTRTDPNESLTLVIPRNEDTEAYFLNPTEATLTINQSTVRFNYRTYNTDPNGTLCEVISNSDVTIIEDYEANSGTVFITSTIVDDDNDGIPSIDEYGSGGIANPQDSDGDGIPDYLDQDDDNDNVLTRNEIVITSGAEPPYSLINTDGVDFPDYLDKDDDNDGIDTILEDANGVNGPFDDSFINTLGETVKRYLSTESTETYTNPGIRSNTFSRTVTTHFLVSGIDLEILRATEVDFGTFENSFDVTTEFSDD